MRRLSFALDSLPAAREAATSRDFDVCAAATLAELAGADAVRIGVTEDLKPTSEGDVLELRRTARRFELRLPPHSGLLKLALEARPDLAIVASDGWEGPCAATPLDLRGRDPGLQSMLRALEEAGIPTAILIAPDMDSVKTAHTLGVSGVELYTGALVDFPPDERRPALDRLTDAARLASKLRLDVAVTGGLGFANVPEVLAAAPDCQRVAAGRSLVARSLLVGIDRTLRDFRALCA